MAEGMKRLSELERSSTVSPLALLYSEIEDVTSESGYSTRATTLELLADEIVNSIEFASKLDTSAKTITGAINEAAQGGGGGASIDDKALEDMLEEVYGG